MSERINTKLVVLPVIFSLFVFLLVHVARFHFGNMEEFLFILSLWTLSFLVVFVFLSAFIPKANKNLFVIPFVLSTMGLSLFYAFNPQGSTYTMGTVLKQLLGIVPGFILFLLVSLLTAQAEIKDFFIFKYKNVLMLLTLLIALFCFFTSLFRSLAPTGLSLLCYEILKILVVCSVVTYIYEEKENLLLPVRTRFSVSIPNIKFWIPMLVCVFFSLLLIVLSRELSYPFIIFLTILCVIYTGTKKISYCFIGLALLVVTMLVTLFIAEHFTVPYLSSTVPPRFKGFLNPWKYPQERAGYDLTRSLYGISTGILMGTGGFSSPELISKNAWHKDFIFSSLCQQFGFSGAVLVIFLYLTLIILCFKTALKTKDEFSRLLCASLSSLLAVQILAGIMANLSLIPFFGIPLPFMSYGRTSALSSYFILGVITGLSSQSLSVPIRDSHIKRLSVFFIVLFLHPPVPGVLPQLDGLSILYRLTRLQLADVDKYVQDAENPANKILEKYRATILDRNGIAIAQTQSSQGRKRVYIWGRMFSHLIGYSDEMYGKTGLEKMLNPVMIGKRNPQGISYAFVKWLNIPMVPEKRNVVLTIDKNIQHIAYDALGKRKGAVVALDPRNGNLLALVSNPDFNPNILRESWSMLSRDVQNAPFVNKAVKTFVPGSTFKIFVLSAALEEGLFDADATFQCDGKMDVDGHEFQCWKRHGELSLEQSFVQSCNIAFIQIVQKIGYEKLFEFLKRFAFESRELPFENWNVEPGYKTLPLFSQTGFGQGDVEVSPLQMAYAAASVVNGGVLYKPHVLSEIRGEDGRVISKFRSERIRRVLSRKTAETMKQFMINVVKSGTGKTAYSGRVVIGGKTGTAQATRINPKYHSWFVGFSDDEKIIVCVFVEEGGKGSAVAAPIAREIIIRSQPYLVEKSS